MKTNLHIRRSVADDRASIETLYPAAFPDEDLLPLVRDLLRKGPDVLSLVATLGSSLTGHVAFTLCEVTGSGAKAALLAPLAVAPAHQRQGIGRSLVEAGLRELEADGVGHVYVLGDPAYYGRLGFQPKARVATPYPLPDEWADAWQWTSLGDAKLLEDGELTVPDFWRKPALWGA
jgi:putative acetyltransferase